MTQKPPPPAASPVPRKREDATHPIVIDYTNWQGVRAPRTIIPKRLEWSSNEWHPEPQWLLIGFDCERNAERTFALRGIHAFAPAEPRGCPTPGGGEREIVSKFIDAIEKLAFSMPAPNAYTPQFVMLCIEARRRLASSLPSDGEGVKEATP
jgi:hypothetical protein